MCGANVQIQNLGKHFELVHPRSINELHWIDVQAKCLICGRDLVNAREAVCKDHVLKIPQEFLVKKVFFPFKENNSERLKRQKSECVQYWLVYVPMIVFSLFGNNPEEKAPREFVSFSSNAVTLGYSLIRICEVFQDIGELAHDLALKDSNRGTSRTRYDALFLDQLLTEFEFFEAALFGMKGFYDIAVDSVDKPTKLLLIPRVDTEAVQKMLLLRIYHSDAIWRASFVQLTRPSNQQCVHDQRGAFFCFPKEKIFENFQELRNSWSEIFPTCPVPTDKEFSDLSDLMKWVASPFGFTRTNITKAYYLEDFRNFDLSENRLFSFLDGLLPDVKSCRHLISHRMLTTYSSVFEFHRKMMEIAIGFSFSSSKGRAYFLPVREWFYNKILPVLVSIGRSIKASGGFFEEETRNILRLLANDNIRLEYSETFGPTPVLKRPGSSKASMKMDWRILEKNFLFSLRDTAISSLIGQDGEIDLIVFANFSLYLLELKSINLEVGRAQKYIREEAAKQCSRYAAWARQKDTLSSFLRKHRIQEDNVKSVRILCCTNGIFDEIDITCSETNEHFAVVPQFMLFSLFIGTITVALRDVFPEPILGIKNAVVEAIPSIKKIGIADLRKEMSKAASELLSRWLALMVFDYRADYQTITFKEARPLNLSRFLVYQETHIGGTWKWLLPKPVQIAFDDQWKFFAGTQIAARGTTIVCTKCKSAIKYYYGDSERDNSSVASILNKEVCPFCNCKTIGGLESMEIRNKMTMVMAKYKHEHGQLILEEH